MSTYHLPPAVLPLVDWTSRYAAQRHLSSVPPTRLSDLTPLDAANVIGTIDAVCDGAPASDLPFEAYAVLDELGANLADWLRHVSPDRVPAVQRAA